MMKQFHSGFFYLLPAITLLLLFFISFDLFPFLRGPAPYPPEWQWTYLVSNTLSKIWAPLLVGIIIFLAALYIEEKPLPFIKNKQALLFVLIFAFGMLFHTALLYYSRGGVNVLFHRILNPLISGYFTVSLDIISIREFLTHFNENLFSYPMYAKFHPPFAVLLFSFITFMSQFITPFLTPLLQTTPGHPDVASFWNILTPVQKTSALLSGFIIMFLTTLTTVPLYYSAKHYLNEKAAIRSLFLFLLIPNTMLFIPLNDAFMPLITASSLYFFISGLQNESKYGYFLSGILLSIGSLFSLTFLPLILFFFLFGLFTFYQTKFSLHALLMPITSWSFGWILLPFLLFLTSSYNFIESIFTILTYHNAVEHHRNYFSGLFYGPFDFLLFLGIPISLFLIYGLYNLVAGIRKRKKTIIKNLDPLLPSFWIFLAAVTLSGSVRVESARIWTPYLPIALLTALVTMEKLKVTTKQFTIILLLLFMQIIIFQSVLVTVW